MKKFDGMCVGAAFLGAVGILGSVRWYTVAPEDCGQA